MNAFKQKYQDPLEIASSSQHNIGGRGDVQFLKVMIFPSHLQAAPVRMGSIPGEMCWILLGARRKVHLTIDSLMGSAQIWQT